MAPDEDEGEESEEVGEKYETSVFDVLERLWSIFSSVWTATQRQLLLQARVYFCPVSVPPVTLTRPISVNSRSADGPLKEITQGSGRSDDSSSLSSLLDVFWRSVSLLVFVRPLVSTNNPQPVTLRPPDL